MLVFQILAKGDDDRRSGAGGLMRYAWNYTTVWLSVFGRLIWRLEDEQIGRYSIRVTAFVAHVNAQTVAQIRAEQAV